MKNRYLFPLFMLSMFFGSHAMIAQQSAVYPPVEYVENQGQWEAPFIYKGNTNRGDIFLRHDGFRILLADGQNHDKVHGLRHGWVKGEQTLSYHVFDILFKGGNPNAAMSGEKPQKQYYNYFLSNDTTKWKSGIHPVMAVNYQSIYPNIDAHVYSDQGNIKYDLIVRAGGNVNDIQLEYKGLDGVRIEDGKLFLKTSLGDVTETIPYCYQYIHGERKEVKCKFVQNGNIISFEVGKNYNKAVDLFIDPVLIFCSFTGSTADNWGYTATYDSVGNFYAGGIVGFQTGGSFIGNYPTTTGAIQVTFGGGGPGGMGNVFRYDAAISKFNAVGNALIYSTYLGGADNDQPHSLIVDNNDNLVIAGRTYSSNFPTSAGCYDATHNGNADIFVCKFNSTGTSLLSSTYVGGSGDDCVNISADELTITPLDLKHNYGDDARSEVIVDNNNNIYVIASSSSSDFPTANPTQAALGGGQDAVLIELNPACTNLMWSTYLGGNSSDAGYVISFNKSNQSILYAGGGTLSSNFPTTSGTLHSSYQGGIADGFLLKFDANTKALMAGTFIGTNQYDQVYGVQTDDSDYVYIMGQTTGAYPIIGPVYSNANSTQFMSKLNTSLSTLLYSTTFGTGSLATTQQTDISPNAFLVDKCQNVYVSGWGGPIIGSNPGTTSGLPVTAGAIKSTTDGSDFYFIVLTKNFGNLLYASFFGQTGLSGEHVDGGTSRFDKNGVIYQAICAACGASTIFPTTSNAYATQNGSNNCNLAALKIDFQLQNPDAVAVISGDTVGCVPFKVKFYNHSTSSTNYFWDFGDGNTSFSAIDSVENEYLNAGTYTVKFIASNPNGCTATADTAYMTIIVRDDTIHADFNYQKIDSCKLPYSVVFTNTSLPNSGNPGSVATYLWDFGNGDPIYNGTNPPTVNYNSSTTYTITLTMIDPTACNDTSIATKIIDFSTSLVTAAFDMPDSVCMPGLVNFMDQSTNATGWQWNFGDGNNSSTSNPANTYNAPGTYTVTLVATNPTSCNFADSLKKTVTVFSTPVANFTWSPNPPEPNTANEFKNLSTGATYYLWDFGDGTTSPDKNPIHVYEKSGTYNVCLTATNEYGCRDTVCKPVRGEVVPLADVPSGFSPNGDGYNDIVYVKGYGIEKMTFRIFNRWGEKVFESTEKSKGWDGRYKGVIQEMEVYSYTLSVIFFDGTKDFKKGNITLLK